MIKDFKYGLGLAHIPTGSLAANQAYFMIAALAWNLKTWLLNLLHLGDGAVMRFQRFRYQWIWQAGTVAKSGRNTVVLKLPAGEYFQRFGVATSPTGDSLVTIWDAKCSTAGSSMSRYSRSRRNRPLVTLTRRSLGGQTCVRYAHRYRAPSRDRSNSEIANFSPLFDCPRDPVARRIA